MEPMLKILVAVDFSKGSRRALTRALAWARRLPCQLEVAHVVDGAIDELAPTDTESAALAHALFDLERLVRDEDGRLGPSPAPSNPVGYHLAVGHPARTLSALARRLGADLVILGLNERPAGVLDPVTEGLVHDAPCPVVCVGPGADVLPGARRIVCPVDVSRASLHALGVAVELRARLGDELIVLHVGAAAEPAGAAEVAAWRRYAVPADTPVTAASIPGSSAEEIVRFAVERRCDVIVMAAHGGGTEEPLFDPIAATVVRTAPCPVVPCVSREASRPAATAGR